ncbi:hypothetical protein LTR17_023400 [Elasticomyces elasticus]|nr:hypothetical protein LTR17_023400 [Elasticomyces elasticus]
MGQLETGPAVKSGRKTSKRKASEIDDGQKDTTEKFREHGTAAGSDLPIIKLLVGGLMDISKDDEIVFPDIVCDALSKRCREYDDERTFTPADRKSPHLVSQGRSHRDERINFDFTNDDGLLATLTAVFSKSTVNRRHRLESALKLFVRWNPVLLPELTESDIGRSRYSLLDPGHYISVLDFLRKAEGEDLIIPPDTSLRWAFCSSLFQLLRARIVDKCPTSSLLQPPNKTSVKKRLKKNDGAAAAGSPAPELDYTLAIQEEKVVPRNFGHTLYDSISSRDMSTSGLEAALEVKLYRLAKLEQMAFPGYFDLNVADVAQAPTPPPTHLVTTSASNSTQPTSRSIDETDTPLLRLILGDAHSGKWRTGTRTRIVVGVDKRINEYNEKRDRQPTTAALPALILEGRTSHNRRIDFTPDCKYRMGVVQHLRHRLGGVCRKPNRFEVEQLLGLLAAWNPALFPERYIGRIRPMPTRPGPYGSVLAHMSSTDGLCFYLPWNARNDPRNCKNIFLALRWRIRQKAPNSALLTYPNPTMTNDEGQRDEHTKFMLADQTHVHPVNFYDTMMRYCKIHAAHPESKDVDLDGLAYELALKEPQAFPEVFNAGS